MTAVHGRRMEVVHGFPHGGPRSVAITIGNFDGVHRGHRHLLALLTSEARSLDGDAVVVTFDPHPRCVLAPDRCPPALTTLDEKRERIEAAGVDRLIVLPFTRTLSEWTPDHFCDRLGAAQSIGRMVIGHDFALGHGRAGDVGFLRGYAARHGFTVVTADVVADEAGPISSSRVRMALIEGDLSTANRVLGHPYFLDGLVEHGERIGRVIGYPTANISVTPGKCLPARGVYATWVQVEDTWHQAATNVGYRPTFGGDRLTVEAFLLDFDRDIYHQRVRLAFVSRLREERTYADAQALSVQIGRDVIAARRRLERAGPPVNV